MSNTKNTNQKVTTITHEFFGNLDIIQAEGGFLYPKTGSRRKSYASI